MNEPMLRMMMDAIDDELLEEAQRPLPAPLRPDPAGHVRAVHGVRPVGLLSRPQAECGHCRQQGEVRYHVSPANKINRRPGRDGGFMPVGSFVIYFSSLHRSYSTCITEEMVCRP